MTRGDSALTRDSIRQVVERSIQLLETKCIRGTGTPPNWRLLLSEQFRDSAPPMSSADFETCMNKALSHGGLSHLAFFTTTGDRAPARYAINTTFCTIDTIEGSRWLFQDVHNGGPAYAAGIRSGDILLQANGDDIEPPVLPTFALGQDHTLTICDQKDYIRHIHVVLPKVPPGKTTARPPMAEPTSVVAQLVEPSIGHLRVAFFPGVNGQRFAQELDRALARLGDLERLIVDLRGNLGGFVGSLRLMSYLTPDRVPIGYSLTRKGETRGWSGDRLAHIDRLPTTRLDTIIMAIRFMVIHRDRSIRLVTERLGPMPFHGRAVILVNEHTLSAGEMVAAFAAENRLATIVGKRTGGQVLGGANVGVGHGFTLRFPAAGWYTSRGSIVEGRGVSPDVEAPLSAPDLRRGIDSQLECAIAVVKGM